MQVQVLSRSTLFGCKNCQTINLKELDDKNHDIFKKWWKTIFQILSWTFPWIRNGYKVPYFSARGIHSPIVSGHPLNARRLILLKGFPLTFRKEHHTVRERPLTVRGCPLTVKVRPLTVKGRPLTVEWNSLTVKGCTFTVKGRLSTVKGCPVTVKGRSLTVKGRPLTVIWQKNSQSAVEPQLLTSLNFLLLIYFWYLILLKYLFNFFLYLSNFSIFWPFEIF